MESLSPLSRCAGTGAFSDTNGFPHLQPDYTDHDNGKCYVFLNFQDSSLTAQIARKASSWEEEEMSITIFSCGRESLQVIVVRTAQGRWKDEAGQLLTVLFPIC